MWKQAVFIFLFLLTGRITAQDINLSYFLRKGIENAPSLAENNNSLKIGKLQNDLIVAQNKAFQVDATSEVLVAPYFNSDGDFVAITTNPSPDAYGYDVGVTNGGLYSAQLNVTKNLLNNALVDNLVFQNKLKNKGLQLTSEQLQHKLKNTITRTYILTYQFQLKEKLSRELITDMEKRLKVIEILVKHGILMQSDYLLVEQDLTTKKIELKQVENNIKDSFLQLYNASGMSSLGIQKLLPPELKTTFKKENYFYKKKYKNDSLQIRSNQRVFENKYKPTFSVYGNAGLNAVEIPNISHKIGASAGIRLTVPIYDGHQKKYKAQQSELQYENLNYYKKNQQVQLQNSLKSLSNQLNTQQENLELIAAQLQKQKNILEIYKDKLVHGQVSVINYLNVNQQYKTMINAKLQMQTNLWLLQNQYNYINW